ncbi:hypothetical protein ACFX1Z_030256 [Malus domestica]
MTIIYGLVLIGVVFAYTRSAGIVLLLALVGYISLKDSERKKNSYPALNLETVPISSCSKDHQKIYQEWFRFVDSDADGRITGSDAIKFFGMANLNREELKQTVWKVVCYLWE